MLEKNKITKIKTELTKEVLKYIIDVGKSSMTPDEIIEAYKKDLKVESDKFKPENYYDEHGLEYSKNMSEVLVGYID